MDHWGDPWADNADDKSPPKNEVTSPLPPTHASAPVILNGFLDDAGWGNEDDGFGEWATASGNDETATEATDMRIDDSSTIGSHDAPSDDARWDTEEKSERPTPIGADNWSAQAQDAGAEDIDNGLSETSDSSTTIQPPESPPQIEAEASDSLQPDDSSSAHLSTSPSEASHTGAPVESPRTSVEDDRAAGKSSGLEHSVEDYSVKEAGREVDEDRTVVTGPSSEGADDEFGNFSEDTSWNEETPTQAETARSIDHDVTGESEEPNIISEKSLETSLPTTTAAAVNSNMFTLDLALLDTLFPTPQATKELEEAPEDPVYSTTGRKAWYRLTRKQTLREFNNGTGDDNHTRVTWAKSNVRLEVNKIVARWAREDRISGTGPGARASFYWDTAAPVEVKTSKGHSRTKSSMPTPRVVAPVRQSLPPLATNTPAAFNWSSPSASIDPWKQDSPGLPPISSPVAQKHTAVQPTKKHEDRAVFVEPTPHNPKQEIRERASTPITETPIVANLISPPISNVPTTSPDPWANLSSLDNDGSVKEELVIAPVDDDDDWGEMISSPTVSTHITTETTSQPTTRNNTLSTPSSSPTSIKASPAQDITTETMHAAQIVRLNGTISPTSALFRAKSFIPLGAEQGPIGPGILKPVQRAVAPTPDTSKSEIRSASGMELIVEKKAEEEIPQGDGSNDASARNVLPAEAATSHPDDDDFSAFASSTIPEPARPSTPPPQSAVPVQSSTDSWADADFSFFESTQPSTAPAPSQAKHDPSDPFSAFEAPPRSTSAASSTKPFTRSPPRNLTPPPLQPLTGATNAAQRRKAEDDDIIRSILDGLPDLSYMLR